jgi:hypothetical protein
MTRPLLPDAAIKIIVTNGVDVFNVTPGDPPTRDQPAA